MNNICNVVWSHARQQFVAVSEIVSSSTKTHSRRAGRHATTGSTSSASPTLSAVALACSVCLTMGWAQHAHAQDLPQGGQVVGGSGTISTSSNQMTINQSTHKLAIDWQSFNIGQGKTVEFVQPSSSAVALNRVLGNDVSVIQGALKANGQVFLVNPNGVLFTPTAQVNVGGIVASTLNISTPDFLDGNYRFASSSTNAIVNQGNITAVGDEGQGGTVALIAARITNTGQIHAERGHVLMGAGSKVKLDLGGPVKIEVEEGAIDALIEQGGGIRADGGLVYLTAKAVGDLTTTVINHTGISEARTLATGEQGQIYLMGDMANGRTVVGGTLDASAPNGGDGGFIETSAAKVAFNDDLKVTTAAAEGNTGQWLIDPFDFTVASSGGDITGTALSSLLANNSITIQTATSPVASATNLIGSTGNNGDIFVNDAVSWNAATTLTLSAYRNVEINAPITSSHANGKLALEYGQWSASGIDGNGVTATYTINAPVVLQKSGNTNGVNGTTPTNFSTMLGTTVSQRINYTVINEGSDADNATALQAMTMTGNYALASSLALAAPTSPSTSNWTPIGTGIGFPNRFSGKFEGLGQTISGLTLNPDTSYTGNVGLFGYVSGASISNLNLTGVNINYEGSRNSSTGVGVLAGRSNASTLRNISVAGTVTTSSDDASVVGGLVGSAFNSSRIQLARSSVTVSSSLNGVTLGGLVGYLEESTVEFSSASGAVTVDSQTPIRATVGGLVGAASDGALIKSSSASGSVLANNAISIFYPDPDWGDWTAYSLLGGLVGAIYDSSVVDSHATGSITASGTPPSPPNEKVYVGGLVGRVWDSDSSITRSYAAGSITAADDLALKGGLIGYRADGALVSYAFWDTDVTGLTNNIGSGDTSNTGLSNVAGKNTMEMKTLATFVGWNFTTSASDGTYPILTQTGFAPYWAMNETVGNSYSGGGTGGGGTGGGGTGGGDTGGGGTGGGGTGGGDTGGGGTGGGGTGGGGTGGGGTGGGDTGGGGTGGGGTGGGGTGGGGTGGGGTGGGGTGGGGTGTGGGAGNSDSAQTAVAQAQSQAAQLASQAGRGIEQADERSPGRGARTLEAPGLVTAANAGGNTLTAVVQNGGLLLLQGEDVTTSADAESGSGSETNQRRRRAAQSQTPGISGGRDASGFMNVFVVRGGVNTNFNPAGGR